jgi:hypothetical protein
MNTSSTSHAPEIGIIIIEEEEAAEAEEVESRRLPRAALWAFVQSSRELERRILPRVAPIRALSCPRAQNLSSDR